MKFIETREAFLEHLAGCDTLRVTPQFQASLLVTHEVTGDRRADGQYILTYSAGRAKRLGWRTYREPYLQVTRTSDGMGSVNFEMDDLAMFLTAVERINELAAQFPHLRIELYYAEERVDGDAFDHHMHRAKSFSLQPLPIPTATE